MERIKHISFCPTCHVSCWFKRNSNWAAELCLVTSCAVILSVSALIPTSFFNTDSGSTVKLLPGDCFLDLVWPSPNLLLHAAGLFLPILSFSLYFSSSPSSCLSISLFSLTLSCFFVCVCVSEAASGGGVWQYGMIIHPGPFFDFFFPLTHSPTLPTGQFASVWLNSSTPSPSFSTHTHTHTHTHTQTQTHNPPQREWERDLQWQLC